MGVAIPLGYVEDRASGALVVDGSLRFDSAKSQRLTRTFSSGNRNTWTWSGWIKKNLLDNDTYWSNFFGAGTGGSNYSNIGGYINNFDDFGYAQVNSNSVLGRVVSNARYRDTSSWYHFVLSYDLTQSTSADRIKIYINGSQITSLASTTYPNQNATNSHINNNVDHYINGRFATYFGSDQFAQWYFIDGQALDPSYFGYTDPLTNTWRPKKFKQETTTNGSYSINQIGRVFSTGISGSQDNFDGGGSNAAFNGSIANISNQGSYPNPGSTLTWTAASSSLGTTLPYTSTARVYVGVDVNGEAGGLTVVGANGSQTISTGVAGNAYGWVSITAATSPITSIAWSRAGGGSQGVRLYAVEIDGQILIDGAGFGLNGFYLPFDGSAPIGQDQSGRGNNWTPVNFGGSNTLEKATGALPILNTDGGGKVARVGVRTDSSASSLVLALPLVGIKSDFSNAINSGTSNKAITANGNAAASSVQSNFYGGSFYFDGTGDYLTVTNSSDFDFGSGNYTLEVWAYPTDVSTTRNILSRSYDGGTGNYSGFILSTANFLETTSQSSWDITISKTLIANTWQHLAVVRSGNTWTYYVNGVSSGTATVSGSVPTGPGDVQIGRRSGQGEFQGYISDVRFYKGLAKYTQNFIPASTDPDILPDTPSGVSYTSNLTQITDGAVAFDGSGDWLTLSGSNDFVFGAPSGSSNDFTIEGFFYLNSFSASYYVLGGIWTTGSATEEWLIQIQNNGDMRFLTTVGTSFYSANISAGRWYHFAAVRSSSTITLYVNGVSVGSYTNSNSIGSSSKIVYFGTQNGGTWDWNGFISNAHIVKGTALYTSNFTPPTGPISSVANTKLLCCKSNSSAKFSSVVPVSGINDGTIWSDYFISGSPNTIAPNSFQSAFDGLTTGTGYFPQPNTEAIWQPSSSISFTTLKLWTYKDNSPGQLYIKDGTNEFINVTSQIPGHNGVGPQETTITGLTSPLKAIKWVSGSWPQNVVVKAININGTILRDPIIVNGNAAATNFNPFTVNINTQRGKQSGWCTWNPLDPTVGTLSNGNLLMVGSSAWKSTKGTVSVSSGKWYYEGVVQGNTYGTATGNLGGGIGWYTTKNLSFNVDASTSSLYANLLGFHNTGQYNNFSTIQTSTGSMTAGDVIGVALNKDSNTFAFYKNGVSIVSGSLANTTDDLTPWTNAYYSSDSTWVCNFGQKPFKFPPPAGFQPLALANTPRPTIVRPDQFVGVTTYTGTGAASRPVTNLGFKPDFVWIKNRSSGSYSHQLFDSVRGASAGCLYSDLTNAQDSNFPITSFDTSGFTLGSSASLASQSYASQNGSGSNYVGWAWKAGGNSNTFNINDVGYATASAAGLTAGTITPTGASVNTKSGFSVVTFTAQSSGNATIGHGLGVEPHMIIVKSRVDTYSWLVYHKALTSNAYYLILNSTAAQDNTSNAWNSTTPTSTVFTLGSTYAGGGNSVAYCFAPVVGYSSFGSYVGNGSSDGPMVYTGMRPRWIIFKRTDAAENWTIYDTARDTYNAARTELFAHTSSAESAGSLFVDILSNGFKIRNTNGSFNASSATYIYAAFAENPFQYARAR